MNDWQNVPDNLQDYLGFVYLITAPSGMKYVGKKLFWAAIRRKPLKGKKRVRCDRRESDWRKYYGSSDALQRERQATRGTPQDTLWRREILHLCRSKWELAYLELKEQLSRDALMRADYYNGIIHVRLSRPPKTFRIAPFRHRVKKG